MCFSTCQLHLTSHLHLKARMYLMWSRGPPIEAHHDNNVMDSVQLTELLLWGGLLVYIPDGGAGSYSAVLFLGQKPWVGPSNDSWIMFPLKSSKEEVAWKLAFQTSDIGFQTHASNASLNKNFLGVLRIIFFLSQYCVGRHTPHDYYYVIIILYRLHLTLSPWELLQTWVKQYFHIMEFIILTA